MSRKSQKGQGLVEFALMLPILLMLILGIFEAARVIWAFVTVQNAAREAARYAVTGRPFYCDGDPDGNAYLPGAPALISYTDIFDPANCQNGSPWASQIITRTRVEAIQEVAVERGRNLTGEFARGENNWVNNGGRPINAPPNYEIPQDLIAPNVFGVRVLGTTSDGTVLVDFAGKPGTNVRVDTFYHVQMIDPIFDTIMRGTAVTVNGSVELQNEGDNPDKPEGVLTGITGNPPGVPIPGGNLPYIIVTDEFGDRAEPAGGNFTVFLRQHAGTTTYHIWFVDVNTSQAFDVTVMTDGSGSAEKVFGIPTNAPPSGGGIGTKTYQIYTTLGGQNDPTVATCDNSPTNEACFEVTSGQFLITARNTGSLEQPLEQARWPISSSIPIYIGGHTPNTTYNISVDGVDSGLNLDTNSFGNTFDTPHYFIATDAAIAGKGEGDTLVFSSSVATTTIDLVQADINVANDTEFVTRHPEDDLLNIVLRDLAPLQEYTVQFDDGVTDPLAIQADEAGTEALSYVVPPGVHTPGDPPVFVEISVRDRGRGPNPNKIAKRTAIIETPVGPFLNVRGGAVWPAGSGIVIQVRQHLANTTYDMRIEQGPANNPTFSEPVDIPTFSTNANGAFDVNHIIPADYEGFYTIRSFEAGTTNVVADFEIKVTSEPFIAIRGGNRWPPGAEITIDLFAHAANFEYDVWLDRGGSEELFVGSVIMDDLGEAVLTFTIPEDIPFKSTPGYPLFSYLGANVAADNARLEVQPTNLEITSIEVPTPITFDAVQPITLTIRNSSAITITNTFFDTDIYVDPETEPSLGSPLPPGQYKNWLSFMPPNSTEIIQDEIVLFGPDDHEIYGRVDTSDNVTEINEGDNLLKKVVQGSCTYEILDQFDDGTVGDPFWTQTSFGDAIGACTDLPPLPDAGDSGATVVVDTKTWDSSGNYEGFDAQADPHPFLGTSNSDGYESVSGCCGAPPFSLYVGPHGATGTPSSYGGFLQFTTAQPDVRITFDYVLRMSRLDSDESAEYIVFVEDSTGTLHVFDGGSGTGALVSATGNGNSVQDYPVSANSNNWPEAVVNLTLPAGTHTFYYAAKTSALSRDNEYALAYIDNFRIEESGGVALPTPPADPAGTIFSSHYDAGSDSYSFAPNTFRGLQSLADGSVNAAANPTGAHDPATSAWAPVSGTDTGSLYMKMGVESGSSTYENMTGSWQRTFTVPSGSGCITIQGYYRLRKDDSYETGEDAEVLLSVVDNDTGAVIGNNPRVLATALGSDGGVDTGWVAFSERMSLSPGAYTLNLGGFSNRSNAVGEVTEIWFDSVYVVDTSAGGSPAQTESGGVLTLNNSGSSALFANDDQDGAGYHLMHQTLGSGPFTAWVRLNQPSQNGSNDARAGVEIRAGTAPDATKLMFVFRDDGRLEVLSRASGFAANNERTDNIGAANLPIWLRIKRNGDEFTFDYSIADSATPPSSWTEFETVSNVSMPDSVEVGLLNAPGAGVSAPSTDAEATFLTFRVCTSTQTANTNPGPLGRGYPLRHSVWRHSRKW